MAKVDVHSKRIRNTKPETVTSKAVTVYDLRKDVVLLEPPHYYISASLHYSLLITLVPPHYYSSLNLEGVLCYHVH